MKRERERMNTPLYKKKNEGVKIITTRAYQ
jgi:hypothetical protein